MLRGVFPSFWESRSWLEKIDLAIIGQGIVGLNAAIRWKEIRPSDRVVILERGTLPSGASTKNAGFACFGSMTELLKDLEVLGWDRLIELVQMRWKGLQALRGLLGDQALDFQQLGGYELFVDGKENIFEICAEKIPEMNKALKAILNADSTFRVRDTQISTFGFSGVKHLILNQYEGQIDTGKMMKSLISYAQNLGIEMLNGVEVLEITPLNEKVELKTSRGWEWKAGRVIVANNGFAKKLYPDLSLKAVRNQVFITEPIQGLNVKGTFHVDEGYVYFRNVGERILIGGGRNKKPEEETTSEFGQSDFITGYLKSFLDNYILRDQNYQISQKWSGILGVGEEKLPIIQLVDPGLELQSDWEVWEWQLGH